ncbi:bacteriocin [Legionella londiniensis]|uniref:Uncharacterized protein n=1 Tax=Legionella londiniensis TaxID=45068 RepID=A0A0W0VMZ7_9GAMM|nr:bacteriocin [Legionella londiniensis]KTD21113.1 hypothetical protein Llon_1211 [Legionella londiniensis]STX93135.1 Uncharacterised protein [Legionella londiniensis]
MSKKEKLNKNKLKNVTGGAAQGSGLTPIEQFQKDNFKFNKDTGSWECPLELEAEYKKLLGK